MAQERAGSTGQGPLSMMAKDLLAALNGFLRSRWRWRMPRMLGLALALVATAPMVSAHSLHELETALGDREKYFQPIDKDTPDFTLQDTGGRVLGLADLHRKGVGLHFFYTSCPDGWPLHSERIAAIQALVNQKPMKEQVQFVSVTPEPTHENAEVH